MLRNFRILIAGAALLAASSYAWAHHAFSAEFDSSKPVKLHGSVVKMEWINPHAWIYMDVKGADGKVANWGIELGPPNALVKRGWTKASVPPGMEIVVDGFQAKDGALRANGRDVTLPNGNKLFAGADTGGPEEKPEK